MIKFQRLPIQNFLSIESADRIRLYDLQYQGDRSKLANVTNLLKDALMLQFEGRCSYCDTAVTRGMAFIDHFRPKSKYPEFMFRWDNIYLSCHDCSRRKASAFPNVEGRPLLMDPCSDDPTIHLKEMDNGELQGLTEKGITTIYVLGLNRPNLLDERIRKRVLYALEADFPESASIAENTQFHSNFISSINNTKRLIKIPIDDPNAKAHLNMMLYVSAVTAMETYLSDAIIQTILSDRSLIRQFVENFPAYTISRNTERFSLGELFKKYDKIESIVAKDLLNVIYHNISVVKEMYESVFDIKFPKDLKDIFAAVAVRHDIVHRNGRKRGGGQSDVHLILDSDIRDLIVKIEQFIKEIDDGINVCINNFKAVELPSDGLSVD